MTDNRSAALRSKMMSAVQTKDTGPELQVRRLLHGLGYRYRLHRKDLPGRPDIVFGPRKKIVFVHGCFWHAHGCPKGKLPKSRLHYWGPKIAANTKRDRKTMQELHELGWKVLVIWQCELKDNERLLNRLLAFLEGKTKEWD